ncbi:methyl-accepting chemotaxis protein, partial [Pseudomonas ogarae]
LKNHLKPLHAAASGASDALQSTAGDLGAAGRERVCSAAKEAKGATSMAASVGQMMEDVSQINPQADSARMISAQSEHVASSGGQVVLGVVEGMNRRAGVVNQSSSRVAAKGASSEGIHSIIQVIKSIAE